MDIVTKNLLKTFQTEESLPVNITEGVLFEHFANFCVTSKEYNEEFDLEHIHTGEGGDMGMDGIAILVNGNLVNNTDEITDLVNANKYLEAEIIFIQSKGSSSFEGAEISNFLFGVRDVFNSNSRMPRNEKVKDKVILINSIYEKSAYFKRGNPVLKLYYVCVGKWQDDLYLRTKIESEVELLKDMNIFGDVIFTPVDAVGIQKLYSHAKNTVSQTIDFENKVTIPEINGIKEAYLGILPVNELIKLITDEDGIMLRGLFYDNVRDFQGENEVNKEIQQTIESSDKDLFVLLNNGLTVVADSINKTGNKFNVEGFQVVNGCQTSHVLYNSRSNLTTDMHVPVRLIVSDNDEIKNKIIKATNRQTTVKNEELVALTDFQKTLEHYYAAQPEEYRLYYERRSQQYRSSTGIEKIRITTISSQIRAFSSMFLDEPHRASRYYGTLLTSVKNKIFLSNHRPIGYYVSAFANHKLDSMIRRKQLDEKYYPFRYHMLMILRLQISGKDMPDMSSHKFEKYCKLIQDELWNQNQVSQTFFDTLRVLDRVLEGNYDRDNAKNSKLLADIINAV